MPVSRSEIVEKFAEECARQRATLLAIIDEKLQKEFVPGQTVRVVVPRGIRRSVIIEVIQTYTSSSFGWRVESGRDQREGDWLDFS